MAAPPALPNSAAKLLVCIVTASIASTFGWLRSVPTPLHNEGVAHGGHFRSDLAELKLHVAARGDSLDHRDACQSERLEARHGNRELVGARGNGNDEVSGI